MEIQLNEMKAIVEKLLVDEDALGDFSISNSNVSYFILTNDLIKFENIFHPLWMLKAIR